MTPQGTLNKQGIFVVLSFIVVAGVMRALPFPPNFAPIGAMALFGGAYFRDKKLAFLLPVLAMFFSDVLLEILFQLGIRQYSGFHLEMGLVYLAFLAIVAVGTQLQKKLNVLTITGASLIASLLFFLISNFGVWITGAYTYTMAGLVECYTMAIPFFGNTILGDLFYCTVLFGAFEAVKYSFPKAVKVRG